MMDINLPATIAPELQDEVVSIIRDFEQNFPQLAQGWYIVGSHADATAVELSDVDLPCLIRNLDPHASRLKHDLANAHPRVDFETLTPLMTAEPGYAHYGALLRGPSICVSGEDVRPVLPPFAMGPYQVTVLHLFGRAIKSFHPDVMGSLAFPDPDDEFVGFVTLAPPWTEVDRWTHDMMVLIGKGMTAVLATAEIAVSSRTDSVTRFGELDSEWAAYASEAIERLRSRWGYRLPDAQGDRDWLRSVCLKLPEFETACREAVLSAGFENLLASGGLSNDPPTIPSTEK
jgi:hypothetical protein